MIRKPVGLTAPYREQGYKEQKDWVNLTDEEIHKCIKYGVGGCNIEETARNIEKLLKEKNT